MNINLKPTRDVPGCILNISDDYAVIRDGIFKCEVLTQNGKPADELIVDHYWDDICDSAAEFYQTFVFNPRISCRVLSEMDHIYHIVPVKDDPKRLEFLLANTTEPNLLCELFRDSLSKDNNELLTKILLYTNIMNRMGNVFVLVNLEENDLHLVFTHDDKRGVMDIINAFNYDRGVLGEKEIEYSFCELTTDIILKWNNFYNRRQ